MCGPSLRVLNGATANISHFLMIRPFKLLRSRSTVLKTKHALCFAERAFVRAYPDQLGREVDYSAVPDDDYLRHVSRLESRGR